MKVVGSIMPWVPEVEEPDEYLCYSLQWDSGGGLLVQFKGAGGALIAEAYINETTGTITDFSVLAIPTGVADPSMLNFENSLIGLPILDRSPWSLNPDGSPEIRIIEDLRPRSGIEYEGHYVLFLRNESVDYWLIANPISFGVSDDGNLVAFRFPLAVEYFETSN
jgi:hypothetical protein